MLLAIALGAFKDKPSDDPSGNRDRPELLPLAKVYLEGLGDTFQVLISGTVVRPYLWVVLIQVVSACLFESRFATGATTLEQDLQERAILPIQVPGVWRPMTALTLAGLAGSMAAQYFLPGLDTPSGHGLWLLSHFLTFPSTSIASVLAAWSMGILKEWLSFEYDVLPEGTPWPMAG